MLVPCIERNVSMKIVEVHAPSDVSKWSEMHLFVHILLLVMQQVYVLCFPYFTDWLKYC